MRCCSSCVCWRCFEKAKLQFGIHYRGVRPRARDRERRINSFTVYMCTGFSRYAKAHDTLPPLGSLVYDCEKNPASRAQRYPSARFIACDNNPSCATCHARSHRAAGDFTSACIVASSVMLSSFPDAPSYFRHTHRYRLCWDTPAWFRRCKRRRPSPDTLAPTAE